MANLRENHLHHATTALARRHDVIGAETLAVKAMMRRGGAGKRRLNRDLGDAALATVLHLQYKTTWYGSALVQADRSFPSTRTCSGCGAVKTTLPLTCRTYTCATCGLHVNRDLNAAVNLARHAARAAGAAGTASTAGPARPPALPLPEAA